MSERLRWPRSSREANRLRCELIHKEFLGEGLDSEEKRQLDCLQKMFGAWVDYKHPFNMLPLDDLRELVDRIVERRETENQFCLLSCD